MASSTLPVITRLLNKIELCENSSLKQDRSPEQNLSMRSLNIYVVKGLCYSQGRKSKSNAPGRSAGRYCIADYIISYIICSEILWDAELVGRRWNFLSRGYLAISAMMYCCTRRLCGAESTYAIHDIDGLSVYTRSIDIVVIKPGKLAAGIDFRLSQGVFSRLVRTTEYILSSSCMTRSLHLHLRASPNCIDSVLQ